MWQSPVAWATQFGLLLQVLLVAGGLLVALAGRFVHDLVILLTGFVVGAAAGLSLAPSAAVALDAGPLVGLVVAAALALALGLVGAAVAWQVYVFVVFTTGAAIGYLALTTALGMDPVGTLSLLLSAMIGITVAGSFP